MSTIESADGLNENVNSFQDILESVCTSFFNKTVHSIFDGNRQPWFTDECKQKRKLFTYVWTGIEKISGMMFLICKWYRLDQIIKYSSVFRENRCPPPHKPVYGGNFSEAVTLKIRSRSPKSNKLLILFDLYRLANLVTFHLMVHEITCRQTLFGLKLVD